jgi:hypothetical protein
MSEDTDRRQESPGRVMHVYVWGDTADEVELAALDKAREFFGPDRQLEVVLGYHVWTIDRSSSPEAQESGKRYSSSIIVRTVESQS